MAPCVIFLDEVDSLFAARGSRTGYTTKREALNEFMMEWDGYAVRFVFFFVTKWDETVYFFFGSVRCIVYYHQGKR